jgi:lysophospholipase L1-like esterase
MGGKNSMVAWVNKGLGQKDYTHFSFKGAKYVGEMFFEAIMQEIDKEIE